MKRIRNTADRLYLIFTRDFSLALCEVWQEVYLERLPALVGRTIRHQILRFNGTAVEAYRSINEAAAFERVVTALPLSHVIFQHHTWAATKAAIATMRKRLARATRERPERLLADSDRCATDVWWLVMFSNMFPSAWRDSFLRRHPKKGPRILRSFYRLRISSEGFVEEVDRYRMAIAEQRLRHLGLPVRYAPLLRRQELKKLVTNGEAPSKRELRRQRGYVLHGLNTLDYTPFETFLTRRRLLYEPPTHDSSDELHGVVAMTGGIINGIAQLVLNRNDIPRFKPGNVLVTTMTTPDFVPIMRQAAAVVTDEGGITCHAAIVSRELRKPCIIGRKHATTSFKDGDRVEVDAEQGIVRKVK